MLTIEINKIYTLRNGLKTSPLRQANNGTNYVFEADVIEPEHSTPSVLAWLKTGKYLTEDIEHEKDIVL